MIHLRNLLKDACMHRVAAESLKGWFAYKFKGGIGGHSNYFVPGFTEKTKEHRRLICGDAPSNTNDNAHGIK